MSDCTAILGIWVWLTLITFAAIVAVAMLVDDWLHIRRIRRAAKQHIQ